MDDDEDILQQLPIHSSIIHIIDDNNIDEIIPLTELPIDDQQNPESRPQESPLWTTNLVSQICREGNIKLLRDFTEYHEQNDSCGKHATEIADRLEIETGLSPLHHAARHQHLDVCLMLLSFIRFKLGVNIEDAHGRTPMHSAFRSSNTIRSKKYDADEMFNVDSDFGGAIQEPDAWKEEYTTKILTSDHPLIYLFARANGNIDASDKFHLTPLHYAAARNNLGGVKQLLTLNAQVEAQDRQGIRPLHLACKEGHVSIVEYLIDKGAHIDATDNDQWTPLHYACLKGHLEIIELVYLKKKTDFYRVISMTTRTKATCVHLAVQNGDSALIEFILNRIPDDIAKNLINQLAEPLGTTLHIAAIYCHAEVIQFLFRKGIDPLIVNLEGQTALHVACIHNRLSIVKELLSLTGTSLLEMKDIKGQTCLLLATNIDIIDQLIRSNADISTTDNFNRNILMKATSKNQISIVEHLLFVLNNQPNEIFNQVTRRHNRSVFLLAAKIGSVPLCSLLLSCSYIRWDTVDKERFNAFHIAAREDNYELIQYLCEYIRESEKYPSQRSRLSVCSIDFDDNTFFQPSPTLRLYLDAQNDDGKTPLHIAAEQGRRLSVEILLKNGANVLLPNDLGHLALHSAIQNAHTQCVDILLKSSLKNPADFQAVLSRRQSPLVTACQNGYLDIVRLLLSQEVGIELNDEKDENPIEIAIKYRQSSIVHELLDQKYRDEWLMPIREDSHRTPLRDMIRYFPECAQHAFDTFIVKTNEIDENGNTFERIVYNYKYIDDYFTNDQNKIYSKTNRKLYRNHPLIIALDTDHHNLLDHPLARQLVKRKWKLYYRYFYSNIALVLLLLFLVTINILILTTTNKLKSSQMSFRLVSKPLHFSIVILAGLNLLKIALEILLYRGLRVPFVQLFGFVAYLTSIFAFLPYKTTNDIPVWQWQLAALSTLFQWLNIGFILRSVPIIGKCIVMFQSILINILSLIFVILPLFVGFTLAATMIFYNQTSFLIPLYSFHKLLAMNIGEFDYETLFFSKPTYSIASFIFIPFLAIMTISFMNLLLGLTVGDIKKEMEHARLKAKAYEVRELIYIETTLPTISQLRKNTIDHDIDEYSANDLMLMELEKNDEDNNEENESQINYQQKSKSKRILDVLSMLCKQAKEVLDREISHERMLRQLLRIRQTETSSIE